MIRFATILLASLLILPFTPAPAVAKAPSSAPQVHVVKQGDTLYEIAKGHGLTVNELKQLNGLSSNRLKLGQKLALDRAGATPVVLAGSPAPANKTELSNAAKNAPMHVVKKGDSLHAIARQHGLTVAQLQQFNNLDGDRLKLGQKLALSAGTGVSTNAGDRAPKPRSKYVTVDQHVVKKGETLASVARRYHMSVKEIKRLNGLRSDRLKTGQRLALNDPYETRNPILLPGDASDDEVVEMASTTKSELEQAAFNYISTPYRFGGSSRKGIDCSAFVQKVFREVEVELPRSAREQYRIGEKIERDQLQKGDLIFFRTYAKFPSHVGIYLGDGKMIHASSRSHRVVVTSIDQPYYIRRYLGAKRISLLDEQEQLQAQLETASADAPAENEVETAAPPVETINAATDTVTEGAHNDGPRAENSQVATNAATVEAPATSVPVPAETAPTVEQTATVTAPAGAPSDN
jgi:LysM repeat protein